MSKSTKAPSPKILPVTVGTDGTPGGVNGFINLGDLANHERFVKPKPIISRGCGCIEVIERTEELVSVNHKPTAGPSLGNPTGALAMVSLQLVLKSHGTPSFAGIPISKHKFTLLSFGISHTILVLLITLKAHGPGV
jgi:hypothetical protein